jgi:purine-nucleoside phosphorylase
MNSNPLKNHIGKPLLAPSDLAKHLRSKGFIPSLEFAEHAIVMLMGSPPERPMSSHKFLQGTLHKMSEKLVCLTGLGMGAPAMAVHLELLIASGVKKIITIGSCGALTQDWHESKILLIEKSYSGEGTSAQYLGPVDWISSSKSLNSVISNCAEKKAVSLQFVDSWTTDALFQETDEKLKWCLKHNVQVVDMEASASFAIGQVRKVDISALMFVSDHLSLEGWKASTHNLNNSLNATYHLAHNALSGDYN